MEIKDIENEKFLADSKFAFKELFKSAKEKNELHYALALSPEFRPNQYNTAIEAEIAFEQYLNFLQSKDYPELRPRIALALYCHLSEASGYWEIVKNMLCIANGETYKTSPFINLIKNHKEEGAKIAPNANKIFQSLIGLSNNLKNYFLAEVLSSAYEPIIRNGFSHADYVILKEGMSFDNRYGNGIFIEWQKLNDILNRGVKFYSCFIEVLHENLQYYSEEKITTGALQNEPQTKWYIHFNGNSLRVGNLSFNDKRIKNLHNPQSNIESN